MADPRVRRCRIPELLVKVGKIQVDLADHLGVTEAHISQVIKLKGNLSLVKLKKTAIYLNCGIDDLYEWDDN
jgi:DNA-binding Xre family transcriptional regulator